MEGSGADHERDATEGAGGVPRVHVIDADANPDGSSRSPRAAILFASLGLVRFLPLAAMGGNRDLLILRVKAVGANTPRK